MEENNRFETNTDGSASGSVLYNTEPQPQAAESGSSSVYGAASSSPVQLTKPSEPGPGAVPVQLAKPSEPQPGAAQTEPQPGQFGQPGYYGQPGQGAMGGGPMQVSPPVQGAPAGKHGKNKAGLVVGILCAAAVVIFIGIGVLVSKSLLGGGPKRQLAKGFANMAKEMAAYQSSVAEDIGLVELNKLKDTKPMRTNIDVSFTDPKATGSINSVDLGVDAVTDYREKMAEFDVSLGTYGIDMQIGSITAADNTLYVSVPLLFHDEVYSLDLTNLGRDFNNSAWSSLMGEKLPEDYALTLFCDRKMSDSTGEGAESRFLEILNEHGGVTEESVQYETIRQKREFVLGGTSVECGGVRVTIDKDAYNETMENMKEAFLASDIYKTIMEQYQTTYIDDFDEFKDDMDYVIEQAFALRLEQDFVLDYYLDRKGRIVNISTPADIAVSARDIDIESIAVDIDFLGSQRAMDVIEGGIYMQSSDEILYLGISRNAVITEDHYSEDLALSIQDSSSDDEVTFWYTNDWGYNDQTFDMKMKIEAPGTSMEIRADGAYRDIVKGEGYTFWLNHGALTIDGEDYLLMTGSIETGPADTTIEVPGKATNVLEMSESDIAGLLYGGLF